MANSSNFTKACNTLQSSCQPEGADCQDRDLEEAPAYQLWGTRTANTASRSSCSRKWWHSGPIYFQEMLEYCVKLLILKRNGLLGCVNKLIWLRNLAYFLVNFYW